MCARARVFDLSGRWANPAIEVENFWLITVQVSGWKPPDWFLKNQTLSTTPHKTNFFRRIFKARHLQVTEFIDWVAAGQTKEKAQRPSLIFAEIWFTHPKRFSHNIKTILLRSTNKLTNIASLVFPLSSVVRPFAKRKPTLWVRWGAGVVIFRKH